MADQTTCGDVGKPVGTGRALIVVKPRPDAESDRPAADFLAQLIACDRRLPAYRAVRRTDPNVAATAYRCEMAYQVSAFQRVI